MSNKLYSLECVEFKAVNFSFNKYFKRFKRSYEDLFACGYLEILKHSDVLKSINDEKTKFFKMVNYANYGMTKFLRGKTKEENLITYSVDDLVSADRSQLCFGDILEDIQDCFNEDFDILLECLKSCFIKLCKLDKDILLNYFFNGLKLKEISSIYHKSNKYIKSIIEAFRLKYFNMLVDVGYFSIEDKKFLFNYSVTNYKEPLVITLIKNNHVSFNELARLLNLSVNKINNIVNHSRNNQKFLLYHIEKIRWFYFPNYSLEALAVW